jgi:alpha-L-rhamnosidase
VLILKKQKIKSDYRPKLQSDFQHISSLAFFYQQLSNPGILNMLKKAAMQKTLAIFILLLPLHLSAASALQIINLRCEYRSNPLGIDVAQPRFSWTFQSSARNQSQSAYEIRVHPDQSALEQERGTLLWSTGKISSTQNIQIEYSGPALQSFTRYYWKVRVYDQHGEPSPWSKIAWFETAMLRAEDWQGQWINDGSQLPTEEEKYYADDPMPLFRKAFNASKKLNSARLYICGLGYYEAFLNGQKIGDQVLDPGFTTYRKQAQYASYDISAQVLKGANTLGVMLGNGWWNPLPLRMFGRWDLRQFQQTGRPCLRAELHLHYADGSKEIIPSNNTWQVAPGPVLRNNVYLGEHYDARLERSFTEAQGWRNASLTAGPSGELSAQMQPPIRITKTIPARKVKSIGQDTFLVDFGQNFAGVLRLRVQGSRGQKITLRYAEDTLKNGQINWWTTVAGQIKEAWGIKGGPGAPKTAWQQDEYTLKGGGIETWSPRFTFHGYRYVEVVGWPGVPKVEDFTGVRLNTDLPQVGTFACSNPLFNQLHEVIQWTFLSNVFSVQSDCPAREKMGYGADMVVSAEAFMYNYDMAQFYHKTVRDFANEQRPEGGITEIAPFTGIADRGYGDLSGPLGNWVSLFCKRSCMSFMGTSG